MNTPSATNATGPAAPATPVLLAVIAVGVLAISSAGVLIRLANADPLLTAFWRLALSALVLAPLALAQRESLRAQLTHAPIALLIAGSALGLHFWAWMKSISLTSITISTLLVTTAPLWVALAAPWIPGEKPLTSRGWLGLIVALLAGAYICLPPDFFTNTPRLTTLAGPLWALAGAILAAIYFSASARLRRFGHTSAVGFTTTLAASLLLLPFTLLRDFPLLHHPTSTWLCWLGLALLPQVIGHNALLWALRWMSTTLVSLLVLLEPVGAALLAALLVHEPVGLRELLGGAGLIAGMALVITGTRVHDRERFT